MKCPEDTSILNHWKKSLLFSCMRHKKILLAPEKIHILPPFLGGICNNASGYLLTTKAKLFFFFFCPQWSIFLHICRQIFSQDYFQMAWRIWSYFSYSSESILCRQDFAITLDWMQGFFSADVPVFKLFLYHQLSNSFDYVHICLQ